LCELTGIIGIHSCEQVLICLVLILTASLIATRSKADSPEGKSASDKPEPHQK
jgi:hypothetical protein